MKTKQLNVKNVPEKLLLQLKQQAKEAHAPSFAQYVIEVLRNGVVNEGLSLYNNRVADQLVAAKQTQQTLDEFLTREMINDLTAVDELITVRQLVEGWLEYDMIETVLLDQINHGGDGEPQ